MLNDTTSGLGKSDFLDLWFGLCNSFEICHPLSHKMKPNLTGKKVCQPGGPSGVHRSRSAATEKSDCHRECRCKETR